MKNSTLLFTFFLSILICRCSTDDIQNSNNPIEYNSIISEFTFSEISPLTMGVSRYTNYVLENNKIISSTYFAQSFNSGTDDVMTNDTYSYTNDKISGITTYDNGNVIREINYTYNANGDLIQYINKFNNLNTQQSFYDRHTFTHTSDTIFAERRRSTDGINYNTPISDIKMILDTNDNRIYFETFDYIQINEHLEIKRNTYDNNNNMVSQETSSIYPDGSTYFSNLQTFTFNQDETNTFQHINEETFGRKNMMLLYHLELEILNNYNPKAISPNVMTDFSINQQGGFTFLTEINSITNDQGYSIFDEYISYIGDDTSLASKFTIEYVFE